MMMHSNNNKNTSRCDDSNNRRNMPSPTLSSHKKLNELQAMIDSCIDSADLESPPSSVSHRSHRNSHSSSTTASNYSKKQNHRRSSNSSSGDELHRTSTHERRKRRHRDRKLKLERRLAVKTRKSLLLPVLLLALSATLVVLPSLSSSNDYLLSFYNFGRRLCGLTVVYEKDSYVGYWEREPELPDYDYITNPRTLQTNTDVTKVGYVVTLKSCPEDHVDSYPGDNYTEPGHAFYDAAAVLEYMLCEAHSNNLTGSSYVDCTFYAIVHPEAIYCKGPDGVDYDRVKVLEDLGYWVKIWGAGVGQDEITDPHLYATIENDVGLNDLAALNAFRLTDHDIVVMVDFSTLMFQRPDALFDDFLNDTTIETMYVLDYTEDSLTPDGDNMGAHMGFFLLKPSNETFEELTEEYKNATFDSNLGWNSSGVRGFKGEKGTRGFLTYQYTKGTRKDKGQEIDRCLYGNANANPRRSQDNACRNGNPEFCEDCRTKNTTEIFVANARTICREPWSCWYDENWDNDTKPLCEAFHLEWYESRLAFEQQYLAVQTVRNGTYYPEIFLGYCHEEGWKGYEMILPDNGVCPGATQSTFGNATIPNVNSTQTVELITGLVTGNGRTCVSGYISVPWYSPPFNVAIVIDVSGSAGGGFGGTAIGDVNGDGSSNTILDAEIDSAIKLVQALLAVPGLSDDTLQIGLVSFEQTAIYHGSFKPSDASIGGNSSAINPYLRANMTAMRAGGYTNFDDALDKANNFFLEAPEERTNVLFFLSDGIPNTCGDGDDEPCTANSYYTQFHAAHFDSELQFMDALNVVRHGIGVGTGSNVNDGHGLDTIDNTNGAVQVTTTDALVDVINANPVEGTVLSLAVVANGVALNSIDASLLGAGPFGYSFESVVVYGLNQAYGYQNTINITVVMDQDGDEGTTDDQFVLTTENTVPGSVTNWLGHDYTVTPY